MAFKRLVRFAIGERILFGDLLSFDGGTYKVRRLNGDPFTELLTTDEIVQVDEVGLALERFHFFPFNNLPATLSH